MNDLFDEIIARGGPPIQELARQTRALIYAVYPAVVEVLRPRQLIEDASRHLPRLQAKGYNP